VAEYNNIPYLYPYNAILGDQAGDRYCINRRTNENYEFIRKQYNNLLENPEKIREGKGYAINFISLKAEIEQFRAEARK